MSLFLKLNVFNGEKGGLVEFLYFLVFYIGEWVFFLFCDNLNFLWCGSVVFWDWN